MTETRRSRWRPTRRLAVIVAYEVAVVWAVVLLVGWNGIGGLVGGLVGFAIVSLGFDREAHARERAARTAVREHRDPGPDLRDEADVQARLTLGASPMNRWGAPVLALALAAGCIVAAVMRADASFAYPAALFLAVAVAAGLLRHRAEVAADRWLADPPVRAEEAQP
jgi:hypothetical protein